MKGRLNLFQRTMLRWRALHPYNAVHVLRIDASLDVARLRAAIARTLEGEGLTGLRLDAARGRYDYAGGPAPVSLAVLPAGADAQRAAEEVIERELNAAFPADGAFDPFRFFALDGGDRFHLGLAYDHFIAGGDSIVVLMKDLHDAYVEGERFTPRRLDRYPAAYGRLLARHAGRLVAGLPGLVEMIRSCRTTARPHYREGVPPTNAFLLRTVDAATLAQARRVARSWGVTLNDLLLALLLQAMAPLAGERRGGRRRMMAAASIVNIRGDFQPPASSVFGQFLSSFRVTHPMPAGQELPALARDLQVQTRRTKQRKYYLQTLTGIAASGLAWRFMAPEVRAVFHAKNYPVWGGVTLLNVEALWREAGGQAPADYFRGVPTGPMAPLVVAASTVNGRLHLGYSWRVAAFDRETVDNVAARVLAGIRSLAP
ncbi:MAG: hypothetical protein IPN24_19880 [Betaproteobacteria bacterium]|jgi:hypothetical protein|nr:hypothetical protein [Betaproteobacteria bacterium]MBK7082023.1 hypothetical protein [Betaproteobacteria bacterium]MBK8690560.1 hypothetical protein [Betaproteobacteria bacterium]